MTGRLRAACWLAASGLAVYAAARTVSVTLLCNGICHACRRRCSPWSHTCPACGGAR